MIRGIIILAGCSLLLGYCMTIVPDAMEDQAKQNAAVPAGQFKHAPGLSEYKRLVKANP
jgi:hypothetical protein